MTMQHERSRNLLFAQINELNLPVTLLRLAAAVTLIDVRANAATAKILHKLALGSTVAEVQRNTAGATAR